MGIKVYRGSLPLDHEDGPRGSSGDAQASGAQAVPAEDRADEGAKDVGEKGGPEDELRELEKAEFNIKSEIARVKKLMGLT